MTTKTSGTNGLTESTYNYTVDISKLTFIFESAQVYKKASWLEQGYCNIELTGYFPDWHGYVRFRYECSGGGGCLEWSGLDDLATTIDLLLKEAARINIKRNEEINGDK